VSHFLVNKQSYPSAAQKKVAIMYAGMSVSLKKKEKNQHDQ
jgi:hypothetical protein